MLQHVSPVKAFTASRQLLCWYGRPNGKLIASEESFKVGLSLIEPTMDPIFLLLEMVTQCPRPREPTEALGANNLDLVVLHDREKSCKLPFQSRHHGRERARGAEATIRLSSGASHVGGSGCFGPARLILIRRCLINFRPIGTVALL